MSFDPSLTDDFIAESKEHLAIIEKDLLAMEDYEDSIIPDAIGEIFRSIHSIKGAAGFMGFTQISEVAHVMETLLQMIRDNTIQPNSQHVDGLLVGLDMLTTMLDAPQSSNEIDTQDVHTILSNLIDEGSSPQIKAEMETAIPLLDNEKNRLEFEINEFELKKLPDSHTNLFILKFDLTLLAKEKAISPVILVNELMKAGIIVDAKIDTPAQNLSSNLEDESLIYQVLYSTILERDLVCSLTNLTKKDVIDVTAEKKPKPVAPSPSSPLPKEKMPDGDRNNNDTIRIPLNLLDELMTLAGELVLVRNQQLLTVNKSDPIVHGIAQRLDLVTTDLQETIMRTRMQPMGNIFGKLHRIVRDISRKLNKQIEIITVGDEVELDKSILESLGDPLTHLVRNCCDHGIEPPEEREQAGKSPKGLITIKAYHEAGQINVTIVDNGRGINLERVKAKALENGLKSAEELAQMKEKEALSLIMAPGFSTAKEVSDISGRGVGMDVVKTSIEQLSGSINLESKPGQETSVHLSLPLTLAIIPCLIASVEGHRYAIPQVNLEELVRLYDDDVYTKIECAGDHEVYRLRDYLLPMVRLNEVLRRPKTFNETTLTEISEHYHNQKIQKEMHNPSMTFAVLKAGSKRFGLIIDQVIGTEEVVVKPMHSKLNELLIYSGATVMGDGKVALILDVDGIARHSHIDAENRLHSEEESELHQKRHVEKDSQAVLLFKSGKHEQFAIALPLIRRVERIKMSQIEQIGEKQFIEIDGVSTLVLRMEDQLNVSPCLEKEDAFLLLLKHIKRPFGILLSQVVDVVETTVHLNVESYMEDGLLGTAIVRGQMTLFIDIFRLIEKAELDWFKERQTHSPPPEEQKHILVVEDTVFFRHLLQGYLEAEHYQVTTAENGQHALEILNGTSVDLIVSDLMMPVMDGWSFLEKLRKQEAFSDIPALALTGQDTDLDREKTYASGFNGYEIKINREDLLTQVAQLLQVEVASKETSPMMLPV